MGAYRKLRVVEPPEEDIVAEEDAGFEALAVLLGEILGEEFVRLVKDTKAQTTTNEEIENENNKK